MGELPGSSRWANSLDAEEHWGTNARGAGRSTEVSGRCRPRSLRAVSKALKSLKAHLHLCRFAHDRRLYVRSPENNCAQADQGFHSCDIESVSRSVVREVLNALRRSLCRGDVDYARA